MAHISRSQCITEGNQGRNVASLNPESNRETLCADWLTPVLSFLKQLRTQGSLQGMAAYRGLGPPPIPTDKPTGQPLN